MPFVTGATLCSISDGNTITEPTVLNSGDEWFSEKNNTTQYGQWKPFNFRYWYDGVV